MEIISHRGKLSKDKKDENNICSINNFVNSKINFIEIDIQITKDNQIILYHDDTIKLNKCLCNYEKIHKINSDYLTNNFGIIYLKEALNLIKGKKKIYLDIKNNNLDQIKYDIFFKNLFLILDDYVSEYKCNRSSIYLSSFYPEYIKFIISIPFEYRKGIILDKSNIEYFLDNFIDKIETIDFVSIDYNILNSISLLFNKITIYCYTINSNKEYEEILKKKYINGIVTDFPEFFINKQLNKVQ